MTSLLTNPTSKSLNKINPSIKHNTNNEFLINDCTGNSNLDYNTRKNLDNIFSQESIYKFPPLIICDDVKRINQSNNIYKNYSDIIYDECGNRFNIRNLKDSAGILQEGYSKNIDVDSHLKNINYYADKCFYDNWKLSPNDDRLDKCNGLKHNASFLSPNYGYVDKDFRTSMGVCTPLPTNNDPNNDPNNESKDSSDIEDSNCNYNIRKRYDFSNQKLQQQSCIKPNDWVFFKQAPTPNIHNTSKFPNQKRTVELLNTITNCAEHDYYQFFEDNKCNIYPQQRLFNNITKRSMLPTHYNLEDIGPKYKVK